MKTARAVIILGMTLLGGLCGQSSKQPPVANKDGTHPGSKKPTEPAARPGGTITGVLKNVWLRKYPMIVYLERVPGVFKPPKKKPVLDQTNKIFVPHIIAALKGTTIHYINRDDTKHNIYFIQPNGKKLNLGTGGADWSRDYKLNQLGVYAHHCNIHDEMSGYIVILENPYYAVIPRSRKRTVKFQISGVPSGTYKMRVWCEKYYRLQKHKFNRSWDVTVNVGKTTRVTLKP